MRALDSAELMSSLDGIGTWDCKKWRESIFKKHPVVSVYLIRFYKKLGECHGHVVANNWLRELLPDLRLGNTKLPIDAGEESLRQFAARISNLISSDVMPRLNKEAPISILRTYQAWIDQSGLEGLVTDDSSEAAIVGALRRYCDDRWWTKRLRVLQKRSIEKLVRELGFVNKQRAIYVSELTYKRRVEEKRKNAALLESLKAENEEGCVYTLAELREVSPSNPVVRRAEMMTRIRGFEEVSKRLSPEFSGVFFTITCPSRYHASNSQGLANAKFNGATPLDAQQYLNALWARTRSAWERAGIQVFGMRVVEPHHDGTPHWHLLLFIPSDCLNKAIGIFREYAIAEDGNEAGASKHRFKFELIDPC